MPSSDIQRNFIYVIGIAGYNITSKFVTKVKSNTCKQINSNRVNNNILIACIIYIGIAKWNERWDDKTKNTSTVNEINNNKNNPKILWYLLNRLTGKIRFSLGTLFLNAFVSNAVKSTDIANNFVDNVISITPNCKITLPDKNQYRKPNSDYKQRSQNY